MGAAGSLAPWRAVSRAVLAVSLLSTAGCTAGAGAGAESSQAPILLPPTPGASNPGASNPGASNPGVPAPAPSGSRPAAPGAGASSPTGTGTGTGLADPTAEARLETALRRAYEGAKPGAEQLREALTAAGFATGDVEVTAGRTPTGLEADAVEVGVREGGRCLVAQVRDGGVRIVALPVLANGFCLVGAAVH